MFFGIRLFAFSFFMVCRHNDLGAYTTLLIRLKKFMTNRCYFYVSGFGCCHGYKIVSTSVLTLTVLYQMSPVHVLDRYYLAITALVTIAWQLAGFFIAWSFQVRVLLAIMTA
jgi:hypothetical protein